MRGSSRIGMALAALVTAGSALTLAVWVALGASLAQLDGERVVAGLGSAVTVERDALGTVTVHADDALDEARALGFVHAQERFFQMDVLRRSAAGELAALVGEAALPLDTDRRRHRLRRTAAEVIDGAPEEFRQLLDAYADGVNTGLGALRARPFEYALLRVRPQPWVPEDSVLSIAAMYFVLQRGTGLHKRNEHVAREVLPEAMAELLYPRRTPQDAPLTGDAGAVPAIPGPEVLDLRVLPPEWFDGADVVEEPVPLGSNAWAVAGAHTADGGGLLANDMHLGLQVPATWFRVSLQRAGRTVTGVTLPGLPLVVVGSNGHVAWGFTNSYGDWLDVIALDADPDDPERYLTPEGAERFETVRERIDVAGGETRDLVFRASRWGPVLGELPDGRPYAVRWVAHDVRGYAPGYTRLSQARNLDEALEAARRSGIPAQNFVAADADGRVGWTVMGAIPRRTGARGPVSRSSSGPAWDGWLAPEAYPSLVDPDDGRVWTANARVVDGPMLELLGDGGYALGQRAGQIRDRLNAIERATPEAMLRIQLDDEALLYARWRDALLALLDRAGTADDPALAAVQDALVRWDGHARVDDGGAFRVLRAWRQRMIAGMLSSLTAPVRQLDPGWRHVSQRNEAWAWPLMAAEPAHLLNPRFADWHDKQLQALREVLAELQVHDARSLARRSWGEVNTVRVRHPLSPAVPWLGGWLDMPAQPLPGDRHVPRVQAESVGASQRMVVSPGREPTGIFHMPGGQSGHPRSPFYGAGHRAWAEGAATPFLPGRPVHTLWLKPGPD